MEDSTPSTSTPQPQTIIVEKETTHKNGIGLAGFILAMFALFLDWIPLFGWVLWLLGAVFSIVGLFSKPRGFAIAGFVISFFGLAILILTLSTILAAMVL